MARIKKGIRSRDALRVSFASLTTPFVCPAEPGRPPRLAPRRPRCARVLIAVRALSGGRGRPSRSLLSATPAGCPLRRGRCPVRCSALARLRPSPGWLLARSQPLLPRRRAGLVRAPGARVCDRWGRPARWPPRCAPLARRRGHLRRPVLCLDRCLGTARSLSGSPRPGRFRWRQELRRGGRSCPATRWGRWGREPAGSRAAARLERSLRSGSVQAPVAGDGDGVRGAIGCLCDGVLRRE